MQVIKISILFIFLPVISLTAFPANSWSHVQSGHFNVSYNEDTAHLLNDAIIIAERLVPVYEQYFDFKLKGRISIVLKDEEDYSNGAAYLEYPLVVIECRKTSFFPWRGDHDWLSTAISHELAHAYTFLKLYFPARLDIGAGAYFGDESTEGYFASSIHLDSPPWFAEGLAQMGSYQVGADSRDPFRDMLLADAFIRGKLLTLEQMNHFEATARERELVYNQGFDLFLYLAQDYPDVSMGAVMNEVKKSGIDAALRNLYGKELQSLFDDWKESLGRRFADTRGEATGTRLYTQSKRGLPIETSQIDGKYVIANWQHDFLRLDLYKITAGTRAIVASDTGVLLRKDRITGDIYFTKGTYNWATGAENFDVYMISPAGSIIQRTSGSRCLAFDAYNGNLVYALYDKGKTKLISLNKNGEQKKLLEFPAGTEVFSISMRNEDEIYLSIGSGASVKAARLAGERLDYLFEGSNADIYDITPVPGDTKLVFVSTIRGTPEAFWCDPESDANNWYPVQTNAAGVRFPSFDENGRLVCSCFSGGKWELRAFDLSFERADGIPIESHSQPGTAPNASSILAPEHTGILNNLMFLPLQLSIYYDLAKQGNATSQFLIAGTTVGFFNASEDFSFILSFYNKFPIAREVGPVFIPRIFLDLEFDILLFVLYLVAYGDSLIYVYDYDSMQYLSEEYIENHYTAGIKFEPGIKQLISFQYDFIASTLRYVFNLKEPGNIYIETGTNYYVISSVEHRINSGSIIWKYSDGLSRMDSTGIGAASFSSTISARYSMVNYYMQNFTPFEDQVFQDTRVISGAFGIKGLDTFFNDRLSIGMSLDAFYYYGVSHDSGISPYIAPFLGIESFYSGYPYAYQDIVGSARAALELKLAPFYTMDSATGWYERIVIGIKAEGGAVRYFDFKEDWGFPVSCEASFQFSFYTSYNKMGRIYYKIAFPILPINEKQFDDIYRMYFGIIL